MNAPRKLVPLWDRRYRRLRTKVLREEPICRLCGREPAVEVDHVTPRSKGGTHARNNLQGVCRACHERKTAQERGGEAERRRLAALNEQWGL